LRLHLSIYLVGSET